MSYIMKRFLLATGLIVLPVVSNAAVVSFTPSGTSTVSQGTNLYWDLQSSTTSTNPIGDVCGFELSDHGDFHYSGASHMVIIPATTGGALLPAGTSIGPGSTWSTSGYTGTTAYDGVMVPPQTAYFGLSCVFGGQTHYGWVQITEGTTDQSVLAWAYESTPNAPIAAGATGNSVQKSIPTLSEWGMILLSSLLALATIITLRRQRQ